MQLVARDGNGLGIGFDLAYVPRVGLPHFSKKSILTDNAMRTICTVILAVFLPIGGASAVDDGVDSNFESGKIPEAGIQGVWELKFEDGMRRLKFIGDGMWTITQADPATGKVIFHHGGSYTFDGERYVETVEFANAGTANLIGNKHTFQLTLTDGMIHQTGVGNPWNEEWSRVEKQSKPAVESGSGKPAAGPEP